MVYEGRKTKNISFPLGGIGTGCIGLSGNGELRDWEIFNRPNKCTRNGYSHFAIKASYNGKSTVKVLHGDTNEDLSGTVMAIKGQYGFGHGPLANSLAGFPHFRNLSFDASFPIATVTFSDEDFPAVVRLRAFNPLIPHDEFNSSLPAAFFEWEIENICDYEVRFALGCTVCNPSDSSVNERVSLGTAEGLLLGCADIGKGEIGYSDVCILTDAEDIDVQKYWYRGRWQDDCTTYWKNITELDRMPERSYTGTGKRDHGTVVSYISIPAGKRARVRFVISWSIPTAYNYWTVRKDTEEPLPTWKNYYATQFENSLASARYALENFDTLYEKTALFSDALQSSTLPESVKDAASANLSVLKSPTVMRLEDGTFWGFEGCLENAGSCFGSCQHVWNYAYAMPYLFPRLERSLRENNLKYALFESGATSFRIDLPPRHEMSTPRPCVDGQMGEVIKCYREWKFSGDDGWLGANSEGIFKMLEYAWSKENPDGWDADMDGVLEGRQHHTLDMELFSPSSWLEGMYLLALDCAAEMAAYLGEHDRARLYLKLYESGKAWMNEHLFNGKYFYQSIDLNDRSLTDRHGASDFYWNEEAGEIKFQIAEGCEIDQMLADWHARLIGKGCVFDNDKKRTALRSLYNNNFKPSMREVANMWRNFALNDEAGTLICTYPEGAKSSAIPLSYCDETMTGFEYALAGLMISEGFVEEGERMVSAVRDRYDGEKRNPWNEIECGSNYARSMASFALLPIYSGFSSDMTRGHIGFSPISGDGRYFFSIKESFGTAEFESRRTVIRILGTPLSLRSVKIPNANDVRTVTLDGERIDFSIEDGEILLGNITVNRELCFE